jgi:hypothetical protein
VDVRSGSAPERRSACDYWWRVDHVFAGRRRRAAKRQMRWSEKRWAIGVSVAVVQSGAVQVETWSQLVLYKFTLVLPRSSPVRSKLKSGPNLCFTSSVLMTSCMVHVRLSCAFPSFSLQHSSPGNGWCLRCERCHFVRR